MTITSPVWTWPRLREPSETTSTNEKTTSHHPHSDCCRHRGLPVAHGLFRRSAKEHPSVGKPGDDAGGHFLQDRGPHDGAYGARGRHRKKGTSHRPSGCRSARAAETARCGRGGGGAIDLQPVEDHHRVPG